MNVKTLLKNILIQIFCLLLFVVISPVNAQTYSNILDVSLKLSLCGDGFVEGPEDCESGLDLIKSCVDYGYQEGLLTCDYSCSYDFSGCKYIPKVEPKEEEKEEPVVNIDLFKNIPLLIRVFDMDRNGKLDFLELKELLVDWVDGWRTFRVASDDKKPEVKGVCDVNKDDICNVKDFSIILYHVGDV